MAEVSLEALENMFREGAEESVDAEGFLTPDYTRVSAAEAQEIAQALMVLRKIRIKESATIRGIDKITEDMKNAYGLPPDRADWLKTYARDLQLLNDVQKKG